MNLFIKIINSILILLFLVSPVNALILNEFTNNELKKIELEMSYSDFKLIYPNVKEFGDKSSVICTFDFINNDMWNGTLLVFKTGKLKYISLIRQNPNNVISNEEYFSVKKIIIPILKKALKILGKNYIFKINKRIDNKEPYYDVLILWKYPKKQICLSYTPPKYIKEALIPAISLSIISENENFSSYFKEIIDPKDNPTIFKETLNGLIKKLFRTCP